MSGDSAKADSGPLGFVVDAFRTLPNNDKLIGFFLLIAFVGTWSFGSQTFTLVVFILFLMFAFFLLYRGEKERSSRGRLKESTPIFGTFISSPMDSFLEEDELAEAHEKVESVKRALKKSGVSKPVFFAGSDLPTKDDFELPHRALTYNLNTLRNSETFLLILPKELPSSSLLEVGAALALKIPSVWFVKKGINLPFLMRDGDKASMSEGIPLIRVYQFDSISDVAALIERHKAELFS